MDEQDIIIREAKKDDMHQVCELIKDLAKYEQLEDQCKITPEILIQDGYNNDNPAFKCFVADVTGSIVGYAIFFTSYSTWLGRSTFLEDLYVNPTYRNRGVGKQLFTAVAKTAQLTNSQRLDLHCLSWNTAMSFYKNIGAKNLTECEKWNYLRIDGEDLNNL